MLKELTPFAPKIAAHREFLIREGKAKDLEKRLRWDLLHAARMSQWLCDNIYPYANDDHIDTALKAITAELTGGEITDEAIAD
jgi:hypothetical protein